MRGRSTFWEGQWVVRAQRGKNTIVVKAAARCFFFLWYCPQAHKSDFAQQWLKP